MRAGLVSHVGKCANLLPLTPRLFEPLTVEIHSGTDLKMDAHLYYEHARRFSMKIRGMQLFDQLGDFCLSHKWFLGNRYRVILDKDTKSFIKFSAQQQASSHAVNKKKPMD